MTLDYLKAGSEGSFMPINVEDTHVPFILCKFVMVQTIT